MEMRESKSGLVVPVKPVTPQVRPNYGPLEIKDEFSREDVGEVLKGLWRAAGLHKSGGLQDQSAIAARTAAWKMLGKMLLGDDCPECEQLT